MRKFFTFLLPVGLALLSYLLFWPVPIDPEAWSPPPAPPLTGDFAVNNALAGLERMGENDGHAPEDIALDAQGRIYGGMLDGRIVRWNADGQAAETFADTGGRPLGLAFDKSGNLIVADAVKGLLSVSPAGQITVLATEADGVPFMFTDDVDIADDGTIYFSDASWKFTFTHFMEDLMEHRPNGRLLAYNPEKKECRVLLANLYFANGVAVSHDQHFVLVCETGKYRITRYWLRGEKAGTSDVVIENLPGFPDGVSAGTNGVFWVALAAPRDPMLDRLLLPRPLLRKIALRLPKAIQPSAKRYSFVLGLGTTVGEVHNLQDPGAAYAPITSVEEHEGWLYFGSIEEPAFARIKRPADNIKSSQ